MQIAIKQCPYGDRRWYVRDSADLPVWRKNEPKSFPTYDAAVVWAGRCIPGAEYAAPVPCLPAAPATREGE
jgi:hypothetical protein